MGVRLNSPLLSLDFGLTVFFFFSDVEFGLATFFFFGENLYTVPTILLVLFSYQNNTRGEVEPRQHIIIEGGAEGPDGAVGGGDGGEGAGKRVDKERTGEHGGGGVLDHHREQLQSLTATTAKSTRPPPRTSTLNHLRVREQVRVCRGRGEECCGFVADW